MKLPQDYWIQNGYIMTKTILHFNEIHNFTSDTKVALDTLENRWKFVKGDMIFSRDENKYVSYVGVQN